MDWTPTWSGDVGEYVYPGKAYGLVIQNRIMTRASRNASVFFIVLSPFHLKISCAG